MDFITVSDTVGLLNCAYRYRRNRLVGDWQEGVAFETLPPKTGEGAS